LTIDTTCTVKAIAFADNAVKSKISSFKYILTAGSNEAWYIDENADGRIDGVRIELSMAMDTLPDSARFISPYDQSETIVVKRNNIDFDGDRTLEVSLPTPFKYSGKTGFSRSTFGKLYGNYYDENSFGIDDAVAPLVTGGRYIPGGILNTTTGERASDTLFVSFSEDVTIPSNNESPFKLLDSEDTEYRFKLSGYKNNGSTVIYRSVDDIINVDYPATGDSIKIDHSAGVQDGNNTIQDNDDNIYSTIIVECVPFELTNKILTPIDPSNPSDELDNNMGIMMTSDFLVKLPDTDMLEVEAVIFDRVGAVVATIPSIGEHEHTAAVIDDGESTCIKWYWNAMNTYGRSVGSGAYLIQAKLTVPMKNDDTGTKTEVVIVQEMVGIDIKK